MIQQQGQHVMIEIDETHSLLLQNNTLNNLIASQFNIIKRIE